MRNLVLLLLGLTWVPLLSAQTLVRSYGPGCCSFGWAIAATPDLDGDGHGDFVAGVTGNGQLVAHSSANATALASAAFPGTDFGYAVAAVPDVNGDGIADVIAGAPNASAAAGGGPGTARLYSGRDGSLLRQLAAPPGSSLFGAAVAGIEDLDADGAGELLVGAAGGAGRVHVISGASGAVLFTLEGSVPGGIFGAGLAAIADQDGDGRQDIVIGAARSNGGRVFVHSSATRARLRELQPAAATNTFGEFFVADAGDVDADGRHDIYVGAYDEANGNGAAYVFSGADGQPLHRFQGEAGEGVGPGRGAGDVDGDGHDDLIVASYSWSGGGVSRAGRARVFSGADGSVLQEMRGSVANGEFGFDAVGIGDVTGDGRLDFLVSAAGGGDGRVFLYAGSVDRSAAFPIGAALSGTWSDPASSGQGIQFEVNETQRLIVGGWFTHAALAPDSGPEQRWFTFAGTYEDRDANLPVFLTRGGRFGAGGGVQTMQVGTLQLEFADCSHATATYAVRANAVSGAGDPGAGVMLEGSYALQRLVPSPACAAASDDAAAFEAAKREFERILAESVAANGIMGAQAAVRIPGRAPWVGVVGLNGSADAMRPELLIGTGSISKMLTVAAALRLVDRDVIRLDDPLGRWFPDLANVDPTITVKQAMQQTSGIADYGANPALSQAVGADRERVWQPDELAGFIGAPLFAPGAGWNASNSNRLLLGRIVERESGLTLAEFMRRELFAGLDSIALVGFGSPPSPLAQQWSVAPDGTRTSFNQTRFGPSLFTFRREVQGSAGDIAAVAERLFRGDLLSPAMRAAMFEIVPDDGAIPDQTGGGLGIRRYALLGRTLFGHSGGTPNSSAFVLFDPATGIVAALSINQDGPSHGQSHFRTAPALMQAALAFVGG